MSPFGPAPVPSTPLGLHRILSPNAAVKVSPICLGGISIGSSWSPAFGANEPPFSLLDAFFDIGGNFIDTSNTYNSEKSEELIGAWMEERGVRDQMVVATKYSAGYKAYDDKVRFQANYTGNSAKSMHISVRDSLRKLRTEYIDLLYVHWWDFGTSVEEVMRGLHALVMAQKVLYLGTSDMPAWVVVKANSFARANGLTPFSVYQGPWNAAMRDLEAEIIPMCQDQGLAVVPWQSLGGGQLSTKEQREKAKESAGARPSSVAEPSETALRVSEVLEKHAASYGTTIQAIALAYLFSQSPYVVPIVGVQTVTHIKAMPDALQIRLKPEEIREIHEASQFKPLFPVDFLYNYRGDQPYHLGLTAKDVEQYQMAARIDCPPKQAPW